MHLEVLKIDAGERADLVFVGMDELTIRQKSALSRALSAFTGTYAQVTPNRISTPRTHASALARNLKVLLQPSGLRLNLSVSA